MKPLLTLLPLLLVPVACTDSGHESDAEPDLLDTGRTLTRWFHEAELDSIWYRFSPELRDAMGGLEGLRRFQGEVASQLGSETAVREEVVIPSVGSSIYHRTSSFSGLETPIWIQWTIDREMGVTAFIITPEEDPAPSDFLDYTTVTPLRLPFSGTWFTYWGGRTVYQNYHAASIDQRFAYDLLIVREDRTHEGDPARNESYFCYGMPVLAPGAGVVAVVVDGVPDNTPGEMNEEQVAGNHVVLDHGNSEFSFLAHLQLGTIPVGEGDSVDSGEEIGRCGNSGRSSEPHLHYHLQNTATFGAGEGLPAQFLDYVADNAAVSRGEPTRGQTISPGGLSAP